MRPHQGQLPWSMATPPPVPGRRRALPTRAAAPPRRSLAKVDELQRRRRIHGLDHGDDCLQVVPLLARDPDLITLDCSLHLEPALLDQFHDLPSALDLHTVLYRDALLGGPAWPRL